MQGVERACFTFFVQTDAAATQVSNAHVGSGFSLTPVLGFDVPRSPTFQPSNRGQAKSLTPRYPLRTGGQYAEPVRRRATRKASVRTIATSNAIDVRRTAI